MDFELKTVVSVGEVQVKDADTSIQFLNITIGVSKCPHNMVETKTVEYTFPNTLSVQEVKDGITPFAEKWVATNYPNI